MFNDERKGQLDIEALEQARREGKKIGLVQGSWDQFHIGHLRYIKKAKANCDYLIIGVDSDAKIQKRKGKNRPLIPQDERYDMILEQGGDKIGKYEPGKSLADDIVFKSVDEPKWGLIKQVKPDVLVTITENYTTEEYNQLTNYCGSVLVLPRQAETSTSDKLRRKLIANMSDKVENFEERFNNAVEETKERLGLNELEEEPYIGMGKHLSDSTDWKTPVVAAALVNNKWYYGTNQCDHTISKKDLNERTELFYSTTEHAEINLLKRIGDIGETDTIYCTLFPCDKCMKTLINKGIKKVYYLEDHLDRNWSKRSHILAKENGIETIKVGEPEKVFEEVNKENYSDYKYIYPPNARKQEQLDIMMNREANGEDPLDPSIIEQEILFTTKYWYISENRFPYDGVEHQFLVASRGEIYSLEEMPKAMFDEIEDVWKKLAVEYNVDGGALCFRWGNPAKSGASLKRLHFHVIMPKEEMRAKFSIGGHKELAKGLILRKPKDKE